MHGAAPERVLNDGDIVNVEGEVHADIHLVCDRCLREFDTDLANVFSLTYSQDFEALNMADPDALGNDGWLVFASVFSGVNGEFLYSYGSFPAPNNPSSPAFCTIAVGEGGTEQGDQQVLAGAGPDWLAAQGDALRSNWIVNAEDARRAADALAIGPLGDEALSVALYHPPTAAPQ